VDDTVEFLVVDVAAGSGDEARVFDALDDVSKD
jgi:hypothetical protein